MATPPTAHFARHPLVLEHLEVHIRRIDRLLALIAEGGGSGEPDERLADLAAQLGEIREDAAAAGVLLPLEFLARRFELSPLELDTLILVVALELDLDVATRLGALRREPSAGHADPQVCAALFGPVGPERLVAAAALEPGARLFEAGLLDRRPTQSSPHPARDCLVAPAHLLGLLRGERTLSAELRPVARRVTPAPPSAITGELAGLHSIAGRLAELLRGARRMPRIAAGHGPGGLDAGRGTAIAVSGLPGSGRGLAVRAAAAAEGYGLLEIAGDLLAARDDWDSRLVRGLQEAELYGELVFVRAAGVLATHRPAAPAVLAAEIRRRAVPVIIAHEGDSLAEPLESEVLERLKTAMQLVGAEREQAWRTNLPADWSLAGDVDLARLAGDHALRGGQIRSAVRLAGILGAARTGRSTPALGARELASATAAQHRSYLGALTASGQTSPLALDELVLEDETREGIEQILAAVEARTRVLDNWGFRRLLSRGSGLVCLFDGPPGTGKTTTTEVMARRLGLELHHINVGEIVDKYIGETEKNLTRLFSQISPERTLLLFDEADSLFGPRVEVRSATDRYANMAVSTLLQLIERYTGLVVLTTNLKERMDDAFKRRITYLVNFEAPDEAMREKLWRMHLPDEAPRADDVDLARLAADFELSGGNIKNATLRAALACAASGAITHAALVAEAQREAEAAGLTGSLSRHFR